MTRSLWCAETVHVAKIGDDVVVLDVAADLYACLVNAAGIRHIGPDGAVVCDDPATRQALVELGLVSPHPPSAPRRVIIKARRQIQPVAVARLETLWALMALATAALKFRGQPLDVLTRRGAAGGGDRPAPDEGRIARLVSASRKARPWIPFEGACLQRAFQLRSHLAAEGVDADWVFGVRTWPFNAHCWLQIGDLVVGDRLERVRRYTPIMSV